MIVTVHDDVLELGNNNKVNSVKWKLWTVLFLLHHILQVMHIMQIIIKKIPTQQTMCYWDHERNINLRNSQIIPLEKELHLKASLVSQHSVASNMGADVVLIILPRYFVR